MAGAKVCAFCGGDAAAYGGRLGRMEGPYNASKSGYEAVYVHHECAVWSPKTIQDTNLRLRSVGTEVRRARNLRCSSCGRSGAAIGCRLPSCPKCYHLPCGIEQGCGFDNQSYLMACPDHAALFKQKPAGTAAERRSGPLAHLKLAGKRPRHRQHQHTASGSGGLRRRNTMTASQLGEHIEAAKAAYQALEEELAGHDSSEPDEAVIAAKDAKRMRKAAQQLAPTLLGAAAAPSRQAAAGAAHPAASQPGRLLPIPCRSSDMQHKQQVPVQQQKLQAAQPWQPPSGGFAAIGGLSDVKRQLKEIVLMPLAHPALMQQLGIQSPRGILLHGPPGTGKTAIVRALAAECAALTAANTTSAGGSTTGSNNSSSSVVRPVALFARKGTDCLGKYAGDAELHLRLLFDMAAAAAPSIIFLDELDGLVPARSVRSSSSDQIFASVVSVMLALMDGLKDRGQVLVIGATNRPDSIDPALRRPGRFDREVYFNLPSQQDRHDILGVHTRTWQPRPPQQLLQQLAAATDGWAGADLQSLAAGALLAAVRRTTPHLIAAIERCQSQPQAQHSSQHVEQQQQQQQGQRPLAAADPLQGTDGTASPAAAGGAGTTAAAADDDEGAVADCTDAPAAEAAAGAQSCEVLLAADAHAGASATQTAATTEAAAGSTPAAAGVNSPAAVQPAAAAGAAADSCNIGRGPGEAGGFLAALSNFVAEQRQQHQWLLPAAGPSQATPLAPPPPPPPPPAAAAAAPEASAGDLQPSAAEAEEDEEVAGVTGQGHHQQTDTEAMECEGPVRDAAAGMQQCGQQQHQQQQGTGGDGPDPDSQPHSPETGTAVAGADVTTLQQGQQQPSQQQQQQQPGTSTAAPLQLPELPSIEVLACDWAAAVATAGPPASKREMSSLAGLNPAAPLAAPLLPLLLPALARVVLLLHRWLMLLGEGAEELTAAAAVTVGSWSAAGAAGFDTAALRLEMMLVKLGAVEQQIQQPCLPGASQTPAAAGNCSHEGLVPGPGGSSCGTSSKAAAAAGPFPRPLPSSSSYGSSYAGPCRCHHLLLTGHGSCGQADVAAAVLKLLGACSAAAVHTLSLPGMLLLGGGDVGQGLVTGVREAVGRTGRGQLLVLYMPRLELWALEPVQQSATAAAAAAAAAGQCPTSQPAGLQQQQQHNRQQGGVWRHSKSAFGSGAMTGVMSSSSSSENEDGTDTDSSSSDDDGEGSSSGDEVVTGQRGRLRGANNRLNNNLPALSPANAAALAPAARRRGAARLKQQCEQQGSTQQQQQQRYRLSAAWSVLEQQLAVLPGQQGVLLLATSHLPAMQLPQEVLQVFGQLPQRRQQQQQPLAGMPGTCTHSMWSSSSATVQVCCSPGSSSSSGKPAAEALSRALDRAAAAAVEQYRHQMAFRGAASSRQIEAHGTAGGPQPAAEAHIDEQPEQLQLQQQDVEPTHLPDQQSSQQQQQQPGAPSGVPLLQQMNAAQQAQAKHLFTQVQQQLQLLGSLLLKDPRIREARLPQVKQQGPARRQSSAAAAVGRPLQQQQPLDKLCQVLPLAGVCLQAVQGWYSTLDEFQADFTAAANKIRCLHAGRARYSAPVAAAAALEDVVGAGCREAARQLKLYDQWHIRWLKAAADSRQSAASQPQQAVQVLQLQRRREQPVPAQTHNVPRPDGTSSMGAFTGTGETAAAAKGLDEDGGAAAAAAFEAAVDEGCNQLALSMRRGLDDLAKQHLQQWQIDHQWKQKQKAVPEAGDPTSAACWAGLHSVVQQFCRVASSQVAFAHQ